MSPAERRKLLTILALWIASGRRLNEPAPRPRVEKELRALGEQTGALNDDLVNLAARGLTFPPEHEAEGYTCAVKQPGVDVAEEVEAWLQCP